jgi:hypothetical protein
VTRPRAADDFAVIRARMEELRRERAQASSEDEPGSVRERGLLTRAAGWRPPIRASFHHRPVERCGGDDGELAIGAYATRARRRRANLSTCTLHFSGGFILQYRCSMICGFRKF